MVILSPKLKRLKIHASFPVIPYLAAVILIILAQTYLIFNAGFFDYDSAHNWQVVQEISNGNFSHLFNHASPTFFLFYALISPLIKDFHIYIIINGLFNLAAVFLIIRFISTHVVLPLSATFFLLLFAGLSTFMVANGRYFSIEAPGLFLFALLLKVYYRRFTNHSSRAFLQAVCILALGITINYKLLLLVPIALVLEVLFYDKVVRTRHVLFGLLILTIPFLIYALVAYLVELRFYQFPATYISLFKNFQRPTPGARLGFFSNDFTFYLQYFQRFESPLLLPGLIAFPVIFRREIFHKPTKTPLNIYRFLFLITILFLAGMHLVQKSPRGLFLIYTIVYTITFISFWKVIRIRPVFYILISLSILYQLYLLNREIFAYSSTNYPKIAAYLKQLNSNKVATSVGLGIIPFAHQKGIEVTKVFDEALLPALKAKGYEYVLLDDYYLAANIRKFDKLEKLPAISTWQEPSLLPPFLYLDQCEFTGFSFKQALEAQQEAARDSIQLRLIRIPE